MISNQLFNTFFKKLRETFNFMYRPSNLDLVAYMYRPSRTHLTAGPHVMVF